MGSARFNSMTVTVFTSRHTSPIVDFTPHSIIACAFRPGSHFLFHPIYIDATCQPLLPGPTIARSGCDYIA